MKALVSTCVGGAGAAVVLSLLYYRLPSPRLVIAVNGGACALLAALMTYPHSHSVLTPLVAGFLSTAAPLTSVFLRWPAIETMSEAIQFAGCVGGLLALNLLYGATFAVVGFLGVLFIFWIATP
jgi:hypothetical protein